MTARSLTKLFSPICLAAAWWAVTLAATGCADPLQSQPDADDEQQPPPAVVIDEGDEPVDGSVDAGVDYTFQVDLRVPEQLYIIGSAQFDGAIDVIVPDGSVEAFSDWSDTRDVDLYGPSTNFVAVMQAGDVGVIEDALGQAMESAGPVCAACGFECRVLATDEVGCQPLCDQCDASAILDGNSGSDLPGAKPWQFRDNGDDDYDCDYDCF